MDIFFQMDRFASWLSFVLFNLPKDSQIGMAVSFFIYDILKIFFLMFIITYLASFIRYYLPIEKIRFFLTNKKLYGLDYFLATIFGAITPFCSCSSIPIFVGFLKARIPLGVTFAFIITSPLVNEVAVALFLGIFGLKITLIYLFFGLFIGVIGGYILGKMNMEKYVEDFVLNANNNDIHNHELQKDFSLNIFLKISKESFEIIAKIGPYIILGIAMGAFIHGYVPEYFFEKYLKSAGVFSVPLAVLLAVPMYSNASGIIPVIQSLIEKGLPFGTAFAFMMAVVGLSLPEALILKKILKWQLLTLFFGIVAIGIIITGYLLNWII